VQELVKTSTVWNGDALPSYPTGSPQVTLLKITIFAHKTLNSKDFYAFPKTKEIEIAEQIDNIADFAFSVGSNYHTIKTLNPWLRSNFIPGHKKTYTILISQ
jgi:hypothetical protein